MRYKIKFFILFILLLALSSLFSLEAGAQCDCDTVGETECRGDEVWECDGCDWYFVEDCNIQDVCVGTTFRDWYCFYGECTYADLACNPLCDSPPDIPTLNAPPHNTWINYNPTFKAQVSDVDNDNVRAYFNVSEYGNGWGNWVDSGGISQWGPVNLGNCSEYNWRAYAKDACGFTGLWTGYWLVKVDKDLPSGSIDYPTGTINYTTFTINLFESDTCSGINQGDVDISIEGEAWQNYSNTINDFDYTGIDGQCYKFRYQAQDNAGNWSGWAEGGEVCIQVAPCECFNAADPCCDGCDFEDSSFVCESEAEEGFQCSGAGCGDDYQRRTRDQYCSGNAVACTGSYGSWSGWVTVEPEGNCTDLQLCYTSSPYCRDDPSCAPSPTVDIKADNSDGPITIAYNTSANLTWTSIDADSCTASGDWTGVKATENLIGESTGNLTSNKTYTLTCTSPSGSDADSVTVNVGSAILSTTLTANPSSGTAPLNNVVLTADPSGTAIGTINYTFYCNRSDAGTNITAGYAHKLDDINFDPYLAPAGICDSVYANSGTYTAKVIVERNGLAAEARATVTVNIVRLDAPTISSVDPNSGPTAGEQTVTIYGTNFVDGADVTFGGIDAFVPMTSATEIEARTPVHAAGVVDVVVINPDNQSGTLTNGYTYVAPLGPTVTLTTDPSSITEGGSTTLEWSSTNTNECNAPWHDTSGERIVSPAETTTYSITCTGPEGNISDSVTVTVTDAPLLKGLVPCGRDTNGNGKLDEYEECQLCHFFILAKNVITFALKAVLALATLFVLGGGILILTGGGSPELVTRGKKAIYFAIVGIVVALGAWVIINSVMVLLVNPEVFPWPWNKIPCP